MMRFLLDVAAALSAGMIIVVTGIVLTVAVFPSARDGLVREIVHAFNQGPSQTANQGDQ
jgi:hypothetical protein